MKNKKVQLGISLFVLGFTGVLSLAGLSLPAEIIPREALATISPEVFQYLMMLNPSMLLIAAVVVGTALHDKVQLRVPAISAALRQQDWWKIFVRQLIWGIAGGLMAGVLISLISFLFRAELPAEFLALSEKLQPALLTRFLYGGIFEEILMRFGFMTFLVWVLHALTKRLSGGVYWIAILIAALLFAVGHLPIISLLQLDPSPLFVSYIIIGNTVGGIIFGWLYWKKGLEAAMIAHIFTHVAMLAAEKLV